MPHRQPERPHSAAAAVRPHESHTYHMSSHMGDQMGASSPRSSTPAPYMERPHSAMGPSSTMQQQSMLGSHGHGVVIKDSQFRDSWGRSSSGGGGFVDADDVTRFHAGIRHAGFLWKRFGQGPETKWKRLWFYLADDRLCYSMGDQAGSAIGSSSTTTAMAGAVRYIALDRIPVRPLPHQPRKRDPLARSRPDAGIAIIDNRVLTGQPVDSPSRAVFSIVTGSHTHYLAAETLREAQLWVSVIKETWLHCFSHTARKAGDGGTSVTGLAVSQKLAAENALLRESVKEMTVKLTSSDSEYWKKWIEEKAKNQLLTSKLVDSALYEVQVVTGAAKGAGTDARVYMDMFGVEEGTSSGEVRLLDVDSRQAPFKRGATDCFALSCRNVGVPTRVRIWHDNSGRSPDWLLVELRLRKKGAKDWTVFPCDRWFSTQLDDGRICRILLPGTTLQPVQYKVTTVTSDLRGAGTDANVHITLHGLLGDGQRLQLTSGRDDFDRGCTNEFLVDDADLGQLTAITIGHDGAGRTPAWHLNHVQVTNLKTEQSFLFPCGLWLDEQIGDGKTERKLAVKKELGTKSWYTFFITTGQERGSGTDADVYVSLIGSEGKTPTTVLPSRPEQFERSQRDKFRLELPQIGAPQKLTIGHNNKGESPSWCLELVEVLDESSNTTTFFAASKWLGKDTPGATSEVTLVGTREDPRQGFAGYKIDFHTSTLRGAGTDANVWFELIGDKGSSKAQQCRAPKDAFERGCVDSFEHRWPWLGSLRRLVVWHDNSSANPAWHLSKVVVTCSKDGQTITFPCNKWLASQDPKTQPRVELSPGTGDGLRRYIIKVKTSDQRGAGTDAGVSIEMFGEEGARLGPFPLDRQGAFERGQLDAFEVEDVSIGTLSRVRITTEPQGARQAWHLESITIHTLHEDEHGEVTETVAFFWAGRWLSQEQGHVVELQASEKPAQSKAADGIPYTLRVFTSNIKGAGTDANVDINLIGDRGQTGFKRLLANHDTFERGQEDTFTLRMADVGTPLRMVVRSDNAGKAGAWHLDRIILNTQPGQRTATTTAPSTPRAPGNAAASALGAVGATSGGPGTPRGTAQGVQLVLQASGTPRGVQQQPGGLQLQPGSQVVLQAQQQGQQGQQGANQPLITRAKSGVLTVPAAYVPGQPVYFVAQRWLDEAHGLECVLEAAYSDPSQSLVDYDVTVYTSDVKNASTDAGIYIEIQGERGSSGPQPLIDTSVNTFQRGSVDHFPLRLDKLGRLQSLRVWTDGHGAPWHLDMVVITTSGGDTYYFPFHNWLGKGVSSTDIPATLQDPRANLKTYKVMVRTSDIRGAGTDSNVYVDLRGAGGGSSGKQVLRNGSVDCFERGKADVFTVAAKNLGELVELVVGHDGTGLGAGWHLQQIEVTDQTTNQTWWFACNEWLDSHLGDCKIERVLKALSSDPLNSQKDYKVITHTSNLKGAGTDARVYIDICGDAASSGAVELAQRGRNCFEKGQADAFDLKLPKLGELQSLTVWHDGTGLGAGWHLDYIEVHHMESGKVWYFSCGKWLDAHEGDRLTKRTLHATLKDPSKTGATYKATVTTGDVRGAGTDARVFLVVCGDGVDSGKQWLSTPGRNCFERGQVDTFTFSAASINPMTHVRVGHDNSGLGAAWHLKALTVENLATGQKLEFEVDQWFDQSHGDGLIERELRPGVQQGGGAKPKAAGGVEWDLLVITGKVFGAGTDADVYVELHGNTAKWGPYTLPAQRGAYESGSRDRFALDTPELGELQALVVGHNNKGVGAAWYLEGLELTNKATGVKYVFAVNAWLDSKHGCSRTLKPSASSSAPQAPKAAPSDEVAGPGTPSPPVDYRVEVQTSDAPGASTDANVFIQLIGDKGEGEALPLRSPLGKNFGQGALDVFVLRGLPDVGRLTWIRIGHDGSGTHSAWHLAWVRITNLSTGARAFFRANAWLDPNRPNCDSWTQLPASPDDGPAPGTPFSTQGRGPAHQVPSRRFYSGSGLAQPGYKVTFRTSNVFNAGTHARVYFELIGQNGSSGLIHTTSQSGQFERACEDAFLYPRLPYLGALHQLRVGTDGTGMFAAWHLRQVEVVHVQSGDRWVFDCHDWLDKKCSWQRVLPVAYGA